MDLGKKLEIWIFRGGWGGVICNFGFGLREKLGNLDFGGRGGVFCNFKFGLREKLGNLDFGGGILQLRIWTQGKSYKFGFRGGGYSATSNLDLGKKLEIWIFQGG